MITKEYFESGKCFKFKNTVYRISSTTEIQNFTIEEWLPYMDIWDYHCTVENITERGVVVVTSLFGNLTKAIIQFKDLEPAE